MFRALLSIAFVASTAFTLFGCSSGEQVCCSFSPRRGAGPCFVRVYVVIVAPHAEEVRLSAEANQWWESEGKLTHEGMCLVE